MIKRILAAMVAFVMIFGCVPVLSAHATEAAPRSSGTTYYVSSLHGAEGNDGTSEEAPFTSLLEINEITLQPGDKVLLERGSVFVDEYLHVKGSGSEEAPIIIDVYGDEDAPKPLIQTNGKGVWYQDYGKRLDNINHKYRGNVSTCILLYDVEYIEISNIDMYNEGNYAPGEVYNSKSRIDRTGVAGIAENIGTVDHIYLRNLDVRNIEGNVRNKHMANGGIYLLCHNPDNASTGPAKFDDVLIEGCRLDKVNRWGIAVGYTAHWDQFPYGPTIDPDICQTYGSTNVVIRGNYLTEIGGDGITTMYCYQPLMEYNVLDGYCRDMTDAIYGPSDGGLVAAGIWPWMCKTAILQYNEVYDSTPNPDGQAWDADWGDNAVYQYNYSSNNSGGAVMFCGTHACNTVFRYNISQNDLAGVLNLAGSPNGEIYNNVFYIKEGVKVNRTGMSGGWGNTISNNIFYYAGSEPASAVYGNWGDITAQWNNNIYYNYENIPNDKHAITADPLFVDPGKGPGAAQESGLVHDISAFEGYKLQDGSPAINAGMPIEHDLTVDFFGNELDLIPDIGAYEAGTFEADAERAVIVDVELGQTTTIVDTVNDFTGLTPVVENEKISTVTIEGSSEVARTYGESVKTLENGQYILVNNRAGKTLTNANAASQQGEVATMAGLSLEGTKENIADNAVWNIAASGDGYTIQDANGKHLFMKQNDAKMVDEESIVSVVYRNNNWTLNQGGAYLNDAAGKGICASGWNGDGMYDASTDSGSQWSIYTVTEKTFYSTELTFTGLFPGTTNIFIGDTLYLVRVGGNVQKVELDPGETASFADPSGNYIDADTSALDPNVATVELTGMLTDDYTLGSAVTTMTDGTYVLVNTRAGKPVLNTPATYGNATGMSLSGDKEDMDKASVWNITAVDGGYTIQDAEGKYMSIDSDYTAMTDEPTTLELNYGGSTWTIVGNGAYLNDFGGAKSCASGWLNHAAPSDTGSQWEIYEAKAIAGENGTQITFTAVGGGETFVKIGDVIYSVIVSGTAHRFENGFCDHCSQYEAAKLVDGVYEIGNAGQLYWFANLVDEGKLAADAVLTADITVNADGEERGWNPIGSNIKKYNGTFDGQGYTVAGLYFDNDKTTGGYVGLISSLDEDGVVKNVTVADSYFCGYRYVGAVVGTNVGGIIENCHNDGTTVMGGGSNIGGIVGGNSGIVTGCSNSGEISSDAGNNIGGIVGTNSGTLELCSNSGEIISDCCSDEHCVGGIAGENMDGTIRNCYNAGDISNKGAASGGIAGKADRGTIENCHNVGDVSAKKDSGAVIGKGYNNPLVGNCYYLADAETDALDGTTAMDAEAFASGEVLALLNGSNPEEEQVWHQNESDAYPKLRSDVCSHIPAEAVRENEKAATCTEAGSYESVVYCSICNEELSRETVSVAALGHTEVVVPGKAATCTETGLTEGKKCTVCGVTTVAQEEIPALGHDFINGDCSRCDAVKDAPFADVPVGAFYFDPVEWAVGKGITTGATATTFNPNGNCQRAQVVTFLWRAAGSPEPTSTENPFKDVKETDFYYKAVLWAVENKITNGLDADTFGPFELCNRAQVVTFLWRAQGSPASTADVSFTDVEAGQFYSTAVAWAVEKSITNGISATAFGVDGICNRAQVVTFLYRTLK